MRDVIGALGGTLGMFAALWLVALAIGNGRCWDCGRFTMPWSVYCGRHRYGSDQGKGHRP